MKSLLYVYRYGIVGGVSTQLLLRQRALRLAGVEVNLFFGRDHGLRARCARGNGVWFGSDISFRRLLRRLRPDVVVVIDSPEFLAPAKGGFGHRPDVWLDVHTTTDAGLAYLASLDVGGLKGVMVPTRYSATLVRERLGAVPLVVLPNIVDGEAFKPGEYQGIDTKWREFCWVGKLDRHKNWALAVAYARLLNDVLGPSRLTVVGGFTAPEQRAREFFHLAMQADVSDRVDWLDLADNHMLAGLYQRCARNGGAMLVTSRDESFGMAAAEALLCGCPLVSNDLPVFHEVFPVSPLVQLLDIWDPGQVVAALNELGSPEMAQAVPEARHYLLSHYGPDTFVSDFMKVVSSE